MFENDEDDELQEQHGAPVEFGGPVYHSRKPVVISDDTDSGIPETPMPTGVRLSRENSTGGMPEDLSNPPEAALSKDGLREASTAAPIARPAPRRSTVSLRGLNPASEEPDPAAPSLPAGSGPGAPNLAAATSALPTKAPPTPLEKQTEADRATQADLRKGSGISQIGNPWARGALRGLNLVGSLGSALVDPTIGAAMREIPGTEEHHEQLVGRNNKAINTDEAQAHTEAQTGLENAQADEIPSIENKNLSESEEARARAAALRNPQPKEGHAPTDAENAQEVIHDLLTGDNGKPRMNPKTQQPYTYLDAYTAAKQAALSTKQDRPDTPEQQFIDEYQKTHPGGTVSDAVAAYAAKTQKPAQRDPSARADKSYQFSANKLDALAKPIEESIARMGRLRDTMAQGTPQADALVGPELLSVMAGGMGSGLRMNEAEIARIVGGRSKWEDLKAAIQKWSTDPEAARSITPDQQSQIHRLVETVYTKLQQKQRALDSARDALLDSDDPKDHRRIVTDAHKAMTGVDEGTSGPQHFTEGKDEWDIPPEQLERFKQLYPNAKAD